MTKWKIIIGIILLILIALLSIPYFFSVEYDASAPKEMKNRPFPDNMNTVDHLLNEMEFGTVAFNTPTNINIDDNPEIQLLLSLTETIEELKKSITEEGAKVGANIKVSNRMEARLTGYKFQITAITPEIQAVSKSQPTEWKWEVAPKEEGEFELHLTLTALLDIDGYNTPRKIKTFERNIKITVTPLQKIKLFIKNNWQWLWAAILVPIAGWFWKRREKRKNQNTMPKEGS